MFVKLSFSFNLVGLLLTHFEPSDNRTSLFTFPHYAVNLALLAEPFMGRKFNSSAGKEGNRTYLRSYQTFKMSRKLAFRFDMYIIQNSALWYGFDNLAPTLIG